MRMPLSRQTLINLFKLNDIQRQALLNEIKCLYSQAGRAESSTTCISECQARYRLKLKAVIANLNGELT